jgi:hypothetical protein
MARETAYYDDQSKGGGGSLLKAAAKGLGLGSTLGAGMAVMSPKMGADEEREQAKREAIAEMKRETRGTQKPANFDAIQEAIQEAADARARKKISDMGYAGGGKVSSASKRADGIATKGKTRGTMVKMNYGGKC